MFSNITSSTGSTVRFNCSEVISWMFTPSVDSRQRVKHIYHKTRIYGDFKKGGRHSIVNKENGRCDLVIKNISIEDAGKYECEKEPNAMFITFLLIVRGNAYLPTSRNWKVVDKFWPSSEARGWGLGEGMYSLPVRRGSYIGAPKIFLRIHGISSIVSIIVSYMGIISNLIYCIR